MIRSGNALPTRHFEQAVPFFARQLQVPSPGCLANACRIGAANDGNYSRRMFQEPRQSDDAATASAPLRDDVQFGDDRRGPVNFLRWQQMSRAAAQLAAGQRTPRERGDLIG